MNNPTMQLSHTYADFLDRLADAAEAAIMPHFRSGHDVENKLDSGFDPVTIADRAGEEAMRALINAEYPDHGILGEEHGPENLDAENIWILDPIDGTRAFITGLPTWGTLIGLRTNGADCLGMMAQPYVKERYAGDGKSAWYAGPIGHRQLKTRACEKIGDAVMLTTAPELFSASEQPVFDTVKEATTLTRFGTDCYGYCMVAAGMADLVIEAGLQAYDIAALVPIIEGAGGVVTTWSGNAPVDGGQILACGDPRLHEKVLRMLESAAI